MTEQILIAGHRDNITTNGYSQLQTTAKPAGNGWDATELRSINVVSSAGDFKNLRFRLVNAPGVGNSRTFTLRINGVDTDLTLTISNTDTQGSNTSDIVSVSAGDYVSIGTTSSGSPASSSAAWSTIFDGTTSKESLVLGGSAVDFSIDGGETFYNHIFGGAVGETSLVHVNQIIPTAGIAKKFYIKLSTAPGSGENATFTVIKNDVEQSLGVTISDAATTGNDTSDTISFSSGDKISLKIVASAGCATFRYGSGFTFLSDVDGESLILGGTGESISANNTEYAALALGPFHFADFSTVESSSYVLGQSTTLRKFYLELSVAPGVGKSRTFTVRQNGVDTDLEIVISGNGTTGSYTSSDLTISNFDYLTLKTVPSGTPASTDVYWGVVGTTVLAATNTKTFTSDAILKATSTKTFSIDSILKATQSKTFTIDSILVNVKTKTFTVDSIFVDRNTKTFTLDAILVNKTNKTFTVDAILKATSTKTFTVDSILKTSGTIKSFTVDAILKATQTKTFTTDAYLQDTFTKTFTADVYLSKTYTKSFNIDAMLQKTQTKTFSSDSILKATLTKTFTADAIAGTTFGKLEIGEDVTSSSNATLFACKWVCPEDGLINTFSVYLGNPTGIIKNIQVGIYSDNGGLVGDALVHTPNVKIGIGVTGWRHVSVISLSVTAGTTYWLVTQSEPDLVVYFDFDGTTNQLGYDGDLTFGIWPDDPSLIYFDAAYSAFVTYYAKTQRTKTFTADATLVNRPTKTFTVDSILKGTLIKSFTVDSILTQPQAKSFTADAYLQKTFTKTFTVDVQLFKTSDFIASAKTDTPTTTTEGDTQQETTEEITPVISTGDDNPIILTNDDKPVIYTVGDTKSG